MMSLEVRRISPIVSAIVSAITHHCRGLVCEAVPQHDNHGSEEMITIPGIWYRSNQASLEARDIRHFNFARLQLAGLELPGNTHGPA